MTQQQERTIPDDKALRPRKPGTYVVNEMFYSIQGEGILAGTPMLFIRFADCNLRCNVINAGFDCDTEFMSGRECDDADIVDLAGEAIDRAIGRSVDLKWVLLTGGEPALQLDRRLVDVLHDCLGAKIAIETNGTIALTSRLTGVDVNKSGRVDAIVDHICVSPKSAEHTIRQLVANEVKYVRRAGQQIPQTNIIAEHHLISPAAQPDGSFRREDVEWCIDLVLRNPTWRLSMQQHKFLGVR